MLGSLYLLLEDLRPLVVLVIYGWSPVSPAPPGSPAPAQDGARRDPQPQAVPWQCSVE